MGEPPTIGDGHWTYDEWAEATVRKIMLQAAAVPREHLADYLNVQVREAIGKAHRHGRSGRAGDEPVVD